MVRNTPLWIVKGERLAPVTFCCVDTVPGHQVAKVLMKKRTKRIVDGAGLVDAAGKLLLQRQWFSAKHLELLAALKNEPQPTVKELAARFNNPAVAIGRILGKARALGLVEDKKEVV
jgi:DNA-binding MarR family transcriptional regulator